MHGEHGEIMDVLKRKKKQLEHINKSLELANQEIRNTKHQLYGLNRRKRIQLLIKAGLIFEEAGILLDYKHDEVLAALKKLRT